MAVRSVDQNYDPIINFCTLYIGKGSQILKLKFCVHIPGHVSFVKFWQHSQWRYYHNNNWPWPILFFAIYGPKYTRLCRCERGVTVCNVISCCIVKIFLIKSQSRELEIYFFSSEICGMDYRIWHTKTFTRKVLVWFPSHKPRQ